MGVSYTDLPHFRGFARARAVTPSSKPTATGEATANNPVISVQTNGKRLRMCGYFLWKMTSAEQEACKSSTTRTAGRWWPHFR
jgi:hypothetical protein